MLFLLRKAAGTSKHNLKFVGFMYHSSKYEVNVEDTEWSTNLGLGDRKDWDINEEQFCKI